MESVGKWLRMMIVLAIWVQVYGCLKQEKTALLQLKQHLGHQFHLEIQSQWLTFLPSWKDGKTSDCCDDWEGVMCDPNYRVVSLSLDLQSLEFLVDFPIGVHFNASILLPFAELRELNLTYIKIKTWVEHEGAPKLSSRLKKLELLNLEGNSLYVSNLSQLRGYSSLKYLILDSNNLEGLVQLHDIEAISQNLEELSLAINQFTGFQNLNGSLKVLSSLKILDLSDNNLDNIIISQLFGFQSLHTLLLGGNQLTEMIPLNGSTKLQSSLKVLDMSDNNLDNNIISQLSGFQSLHTLNLEGSQLTGIVPIHALNQLRNLKVLDLSSNKITEFTGYNGSLELLSSLKVLDLTNNMLNNNIVSQLSGFQSLHTLHLGYNRLTGIIPINDLHQLRNLEVLHFRSNFITGFTNYNASIYGEKTSLQKLDLSQNQLAWEVLVLWLRNLTSLETLNLSFNQLVGKIPIWFQNLTNLETLDLSYNQLVGEIPKWLGNLTSLETLDLHYNQFVGNIGSSSLVYLISLKDLTLSHNHFQIPYSFQSFANHTKLKTFVGDSNKIVHDHIQHPFPLKLQLQELSLSDCALFAYPSFLPYQRDLSYVDLSHNLIQEEFPSWLFENNIKLDTIILKNNSIIGTFQLPSLTHTYLSEIVVDHNKIQGHIPANISVIFPNLVELDLSYNEFKGNVPSDIGDLNSLEALYLSNNHLSGKINNLPKTLSYLDLSNNEFKGELPPTQGLLSLQILNLQDNNYSIGLQIMNKFGPSLEVLNLSNNSLGGPIPKHIYNSSSLTFLDVSFNRLSGPLPLFTSSNYITTLILRNNRLSGDVTNAFFDKISEVSVLDMSNNELKGQIPEAIGNLNNIRVLLLRGNKFQGQIPGQLCNLTKLSILDLSSNNLHGSIPTCLGHIGIMMDINLGVGIGSGMLISSTDQDRNTFYNNVEFMTKNMAYTYKGNILNYMSGIDLSCNKLTGHIPHEIGNLSNIQTLNLSHNQLSGVIPSTFSNLKSIESLDLSYNHLNGRIPAEVTNLNTLEVFNVSYNNLSGRIPFQGQSSTFDATSYKANPFLCGPPLTINCTTSESPSTGRSESRDNEDGDGWIDMETFYVTFAVSGVTMFLAVVIIMLINPHWWNASFYLFKTCIFSSYYFVEDSIRKIRRARRV